MPSTGQVLCTDCGPEACRRKTAGNNFAALLGDDASDEEETLKLLPLPRVKASELTYLTFLREFALPGKPFILEGVGDDWPARVDESLARCTHPPELCAVASHQAGLLHPDPAKRMLLERVLEAYPVPHEEDG